MTHDLDPEIMATISGGQRRGDREGPARRHLHDLLKTGYLEGYGQLETLEVNPPQTWADPYEGITFWFKGDAKWAVTRVNLHPAEFLQIQYQIAVEKYGTDDSIEEWMGSRSQNVLDLAEVWRDEPGVLPMPLIELDPSGELRLYQEGRSRGILALSLHHETMNVAIAASNFR